MGDRARQGAVERAALGCLAATLLLTVLVVTLAVVLGPSPLLGGLLVVAGIGLAAVGWAVRRLWDELSAPDSERWQLLTVLHG